MDIPWNIPLKLEITKTGNVDFDIRKKAWHQSDLHLCLYGFPTFNLFTPKDIDSLILNDGTSAIIHIIKAPNFI